MSREKALLSRRHRRRAYESDENVLQDIMCHFGGLL